MGNEMFRHAYLYAQVREGKIPDFYLQDYRYFEKYKNEIREMFGKGIGFLPFVGIHVRRAPNPTNPEEPDYSANNFYVNLADDTDYYERAMELFPDKRFLIFSDDVAYCKNRFKGDRIKVVEGGTELEDFNQLASCESQIIANSSFSYWAAYLNQHPNPKIVAPKMWFSDGVERTMCPPEWIRI